MHRQTHTFLFGLAANGIAVVALSVLLIVAWVRLGNQAATQAQVHHVLLHDCQRENILRKSDNNAHYGDYVVFSFVEKRFLVPTKTETPAQKQITAEFTSALHRAVDDSAWTPPTDCALAVNTQGAQYSSPSPVPFSKRLPPASALPAR